jgi:hypothetical protein
MDGGAWSRGGARKVTRTGKGSESIRVEEGGNEKGKKRRIRGEKRKRKKRKKEEKSKRKIKRRAI